MQASTEKQQEVLRRFGPKLYEVFLLADTELPDSHCSCCEDKRKLLREIQHELVEAR